MGPESLQSVGLAQRTRDMSKSCSSDLESNGGKLGKISCWSLEAASSFPYPMSCSWGLQMIVGGPPTLWRLTCFLQSLLIPMFIPSKKNNWTVTSGRVFGQIASQQSLSGHIKWTISRAHLCIVFTVFKTLHPAEAQTCDGAVIRPLECWDSVGFSFCFPPSKGCLRNSGSPCLSVFAQVWK